jgi:transcriptional regulator with XRE-family HTH domain
MQISEKIRELCKKQQLSLSGLEKKLGFGNATISRWDINVPSADKLLKVAQYFGVSVDYLLDNKNASPPEYEGLTEDEISKMETFKAFVLAERAKKEQTAYKEQNGKVAGE